MTTAMDDVDLRPAQQALNHIRGYLITRNVEDLKPIDGIVDGILRRPATPGRDETLAVTLAAVLGSALTDAEAAIALDLTEQGAAEARRIGYDIGVLKPQMAQAA